MKYKFHKVYRYRAKLNNSEYVVWRVCAASRAEADAKVEDYLAECKKNGFCNMPIEIDFANEEEGLVLY